jgi:hypothetical protein
MRLVRDQTVRKPQDPESLRVKPRIPNGVTLDIDLVEITIGFDDEPMPHANKVHNEAAVRDLAAKFQIAESSVSQGGARGLSPWPLAHDAFVWRGIVYGQWGRSRSCEGS